MTNQPRKSHLQTTIELANKDRVTITHANASQYYQGASLQERLAEEARIYKANHPAK